MSKDWGLSLSLDRQALGFTQQQFCSAFSEFAKTVVQQQSLARWEKGAIPHYDTRVSLFNFLKHIFEANGLESEIVKIGVPQASATKRVKEYLALNPNATGVEAAEAIGVSHNNLRRIKSINGLNNRNTIDELMKIVDDKELEILKLKDIIRTLIS
jgi:transcriptional regulator with XRE-family HTH domain